MNILHLLSQTHLTGSEVYAASLIKRQIRDGHSCIIVSDTLSVQTDAQHVAMSIHNRSWLNRLSNIIRLVRLCREQKIDLIHAHSRAASWLANIVSKIIPVAYLSTVHGRQSIHASSKRFNVYGKHIITVCENVGRHLKDDLGIRDAKIVTIRNGID
jgi:hypothetical protein